jgi:site-specific recombinase XerD
MKTVKLEDLVRMYLIEVRENAALKAELEAKKFLEDFIDFLKKKNIALKHMNNFKENEIVEYYLYVKEKTNYNQKEVAGYINAMYSFLQFLEKEDYLKLDWFRVKEPAASYGSEAVKEIV